MLIYSYFFEISRLDGKCNLLYENIFVVIRLVKKYLEKMSIFLMVGSIKSSTFNFFLFENFWRFS